MNKVTGIHQTDLAAYESDFDLSVAMQSDEVLVVDAGYCLYIRISAYFVALPFTGRTFRLREFAFTGFHPVSFLPDRRKIHSKHYGAPARANSPPHC